MFISPCIIIGAFACLVFLNCAFEYFSRFCDRTAFPSQDLLICSKARLKKHFPLSVAVFDRKHVNRIPQPKVRVSVVVQATVKVTVKRRDYYVGITNCEQLFGSNGWVKVVRGQLWSERNPSWTQLRFLTATVCLRPKFFQRACEYTYVCINSPYRTQFTATIYTVIRRPTFSWSMPRRKPQTTRRQQAATCHETLRRKIIAEKITVNIRVNERAICNTITVKVVILIIIK